ncbi:aldose epimerase family protein [Novosphingobium umbonatum]|nr:aldose epimerase family protein [Novosphingobium umbonatum]
MARPWDGLLALALLGMAVGRNMKETAMPTATRDIFGTMPDGTEVERITLRNGQGMSASIISYGAILQALCVPDAAGRVEDVVLGYAGLDDYLARGNFFGGSIGRYANRIAGGRFTLDGVAYQATCNDGSNCLHGGAKGFDQRLWSVEEVGEGEVTLRYTSADGEEGFPGELTVWACYQLDEAGVLSLTYRACSDRATIVNLTGHAYFNLAGEAAACSIEGHHLMIPADHYVPVDERLIPLGAVAPVAGTPFDFRQSHAVGARLRADDRQLSLGRGYDHSWVLGDAPRPEPFLHARVSDPASGRVMEVWSNQPGLQLYTGNFLDGTIRGKSGHAYRQGDALCLEPQLLPDTPNRPEFGSARLEAGALYQHQILYRFGVDAG